MKRSRLHLYALFTACCTLLLVMSGAALTSSRDQPRQAIFQKVHIAVALADVLLTAGLSSWLVRSGERTSVPRLGWGALAIAAVDTALGHGLSGPGTGTLHACLAPLLFANLAAICLCTSPSWQREPELVRDFGWPSLRFLSIGAVFLVAVQVVFGAGFRQNAVGVMPHLIGALIVALFIVIVGAFVSNQFPKHRSLRPIATGLMVITGIQVLLGMTAFLMLLMQMAGTLAFLAVSVAHGATGSLTLAMSIMLAMEVRRSVQPREQIA